MRPLMIGVLLALTLAAGPHGQSAPEAQSGDRRREGREIRLFNGRDFSGWTHIRLTPIVWAK